MSREIQLASHANLAASQDDLWHGGSALGLAAGPPPPSPMKKVNRLLRGRWGLAITLTSLGAIVGGLAGWIIPKARYSSESLIWIKPIIPSLMTSDRVMPFYTLYVQGQAEMVGNEQILRKAVQSEGWRATGLPSGDDLLPIIKTNLDVAYTKNTQHITATYTDEKPEVAQAAVSAIVHAYESLYSDVNGREAQDKLQRIEQKRDELDRAIRGVQGQITALAEKYGSDDLKILYDETQRRLISLRDEVRKTDMMLDSAQASIPKDLNNADPTKGLSLEQIAANDATMRAYLQTRGEMEFRLEQLKRTQGVGSIVYRNALDDLRLQSQRIETYAAEYRKHFYGGQFFNFDNLQAVPLTRENFDQLQRRADELHKQYDHDRDEAKEIAVDWSTIYGLKQKIAGFQSDLEKVNRQYDEQLANAAMGGTLTVVNYGDMPVPAPDKKKQMAFVGFVLGGGFPFGLLLLIGLLDVRMRYSAEAGDDMTGMTLLGILPNLPDRLSDPGQAATAAHCVHQIRTMLQINSDENHNVYAITSASPGDGKTSLTLALGLSFAASGSRTLLIDCDLVGAGLTARLDMSGPDGVLEAMTNRDLLPYVRPTDIADLSMLPVGQAQAHHAGMFSPAALRRLLVEAKKHFEIILIDSGPLLGSIEATPACAAADGVILCVSRGQQRPLVEKAMSHLMSIGAKFAGVVFNRAQARDFARSISGISLRSIARQHQAAGNGHGSNGRTNGHGSAGFQKSEGVKSLGPVARAVASSVKPPADDA